MKLFEVPVQEKEKKGEERKRIKSHLVVSENAATAKVKVTAEFGPGFRIGKANMIADFNPK